MHRGRPPITRARVLTYWRKHGPCSLGQVMRGTGVERSYLKRIFRQMKGSEMITVEIVERFFAKVDKTPGYGPHGGCWVWTGALDSYGYARGLLIDGKHIRGTHMALAIAGVERPSPEMLALHSCDNRRCVNPSHLRWGTGMENAEDHRERGVRGPRWLPDDVVHEIHRSSETNTEIALRLGLTPAGICNIRKGRTHRRIFDHYCPVPRGSEIA